MRSVFLSSFVLLALFNCAETAPSKPYRVDLRHIEGKGIGYKQGYTSLDLFLSHRYKQSVPFFNLRGHIFDNGRMAANVGLGYRHLVKTCAFGGNLFYDYRRTNRFHYNQIGAGFELLAHRWDFRFNGYLPVGKTNSSWYQQSFDSFQGNSLLIKRKQEYSMKGLDAEAGCYSNEIRSFWFYGGIGPYYYEGKGKNAYGGKVRLVSSYKTYASLELSSSYDNVFRDIFQAQVSLSLPLGPKSRWERKSSSTDLPSFDLLPHRSVQPVVREEIIVTNQRQKKSIAIDPVTHLPYSFIFVDNTSHSSGTFESPYPTLDEALQASHAGDILYIFPGDGTATGLTTDTGFALLDRQQLLGSSTSYTLPTTLGPVSLPPLTAALPYLLGGDGADSVVIAANQNTIAGLHIQTTGAGADCISQDGHFDLAVIDNLLEPSGANDNGIDLTNATGIYSIQNNTLNGTSHSIQGIYITAAGPLQLSISNNRIDTFDEAITIGNESDQATLTATLQNNTIENAISGITATTSHSNVNLYKVLSNQLVNTNSEFMNFTSADESLLCLRCQNNSASGGGDYLFTQEDTSTFNLEPFIGNTPEGYSDTGTITLVPQYTCE